MVKKKHRAFIECAAVYGTDIGKLERRDYERFAALHLSRHHGLNLQSWGISQGAKAALMPMFGTMPLEWFQAWNTDQSKAQMLFERAKADADALARPKTE